MNIKKARKDIKKDALKNLEGKWGAYILVSILGFIILYLSLIVGILLLIIPGLIVAALGTFAFNNLSLTVLDGKNPEVEDLFAFNGKTGRIIGSFFLIMLITMIGMIPYIISIILLEYVEGIMAVPLIVLVIVSLIFVIYLSLRYYYTFYIIRDTNLTASEALKKSAHLTKGNKWRMILFSLSFLGWQLLVPFTLGILYFWLGPYMSVATANLYRSIAAEKDLELDLPEFKPEEDLSQLTDY